MSIKIKTEKAPAAIGPYSQAMVVGNLIFTSGQIPLDPETGAMVGENITGSFAFQKLNLKTVGPKSDFTYNVMRVTASYNGTVYLRGRDYDVYNGTAWESSGGREMAL